MKLEEGMQEDAEWMCHVGRWQSAEGKQPGGWQQQGADSATVSWGKKNLGELGQEREVEKK